MTIYTVGDISVILEEVISIGSLHRSGSNYSHLDIYLRGGQKVVAEISADDEDKVGQSDLSTIGFVQKRERVIKEFTDAWMLVNKKDA